MASRLTLILPLLGLVCIAAGYHPRTVVHREKRSASDTGCDKHSRYRKADGSCNSLIISAKGAVDQQFRRLKQPVYKDANQPVLTGKGNAPLPSARLVSTTIHKDKNKPMQKGSAMLMEWGQFLAHDLAATKSADSSDTCCSDIESLVINGDLHEDVKTGGSCFPIIIPAGDRYFTRNETRCMTFTRSARVQDDKGRVQQINTISSFVDGGMVYGSSDEDTNELRAGNGGKLKVKDDFLPESTEFGCLVEDEDNDKDYCMHAGDFRVNAFPGLGAMHTVFVRYHNAIAKELKKAHKYEDDEKLFQEARRIVIAVLQAITFTEYIPMVIGQKAMKEYNITETWAYDVPCNPAISNAFATAAFRFGHSMVPSTLEVKKGKKVELVNLFDRPSYVVQHLDGLVAGLAKHKGQKVDRFFSQGMSDQLFEREPQGGFDIVSRNIQRGRDHGLPSYNAFRTVCGLNPYTKFKKLPHSSKSYKKIYNHVDDIDLYTGAINEDPVDGGQVGETFACLIGEQFQRLRMCDRFFYENNDSKIGFTDAQIEQIEATKLSHVLCKTGVVKKVQKHVFKVDDKDSNPKLKCSKLLENTLNPADFGMPTE